MEIYTDVDGIMTADPRVEPDAKVLDYIDYEEVFQMADKGAKVIHPRAVQIAKDGNITLAIKNTLNPSYEGTKICSYEEVFQMADKGAKVIHPRAVQIAKDGNITLAIKNTLNPSYEGTKICSVKNIENDGFECCCKEERFAVANKRDIVQIKIKDNGTFTDILSEMEEKNISMDMINFFIGEKAFVIDEKDKDSLEKILKDNGVNYEIKTNCAKVTLIGSSMTGIPGVMSKVARGLKEAEIPLLQTSDSSMTISCLVDENDMEKAVHAIHSKFCC